MKKNTKKNNKGFSLVELIVVVLIMAIIAVALAPQVMKWVDNARITADQNAGGNLKTAVQVAVADFQSKGGTISAVSYTIDGTKVNVVGGTDITVGTKKLGDIIDENLGGETYKVKYTGKDDRNASVDTKFTITVSADGLVTVTGGGIGVSLK